MHTDSKGGEIKNGDTVTFWLNGYRFPFKGHVRELCKDSQVIIDLFQRLENGQTRVTMPAVNVTVVPRESIWRWVGVVILICTGSSSVHLSNEYPSLVHLPGWDGSSSPRQTSTR